MIRGKLMKTDIYVLAFGTLLVLIALAVLR